MEPTRDDERVRDHLANERTYLAWLRTGIATMGFGIVIAKLRGLLPPGALTAPTSGVLHTPTLGLLFTVVGLLTIGFALQRYLSVQKQIREGRYTAGGLLLTFYAVILAALGLLVIWYLVQTSHVS